MPDKPRELRPTVPGWTEIRVPAETPLLGDATIKAASAWQRGATCVLSSLDDAELPDRSGIGLQWHISISRIGRGGATTRPHWNDVRAALRAFRMARAEEDNHEPGNARHFWMPLDPAHRVDCECKTDEQVIVEPDGHRWTNPIDGPCRGCTSAPITGRPCPLHAGCASP